jgi:cellulose synthase/poly-beta-1,6-N-acetylglucosamine synthase-like glycosyltransferase
MSAPELSVIVPVYSGAAYLRETLDALLAQTFKNFELVAVDGAALRIFAGGHPIMAPEASRWRCTRWRKRRRRA